ncbi:MAG: outer membrane beta-barrel protein [Chitinophagaceae bacterium]
MMKKLTLVLTALSFYAFSFAQSDTLTRIGAPAPAVKRDWSKMNLSNRANDHLVIQLGYVGWAAKPDSIKTKGLPRSLSVYFMLDFPFKTDPRFSVGIGAGISGSSIGFDKTIVQIAGNSTKLNFKNVSDTSQFKKFKLTTVYAEVPVELRYTVHPEHNAKSWKFVVGAKIGTMLNAHTKGKTLQTKTGTTLNAYTLKESSKRYFNGTRLSGTARIGYGIFSVFGTYQINQFIKEGLGPNVHPYSVGLCISGL